MDIKIKIPNWIVRILLSEQILVLIGLSIIFSSVPLYQIPGYIEFRQIIDPSIYVPQYIWSVIFGLIALTGCISVVFLNHKVWQVFCIECIIIFTLIALKSIEGDALLFSFLCLIMMLSSIYRMLGIPPSMFVPLSRKNDANLYNEKK